MIAGAQGICFSVASNTALHVLTQILAHGRVRRSRIGVVGEQIALPARVQYRAEIAQASGVRVADVATGSPADRAGVRAGDIIVALDNEPVTGVDDISRLLDDRRIGRAVTARLVRPSGVVAVELVPEERPADAA
jgi:S1-C subfamily serine protease